MRQTRPCMVRRGGGKAATSRPRGGQASGGADHAMQKW
jgi:hypothetical protein